MVVPKEKSKYPFPPFYNKYSSPFLTASVECLDVIKTVDIRQK
jgi:hypothetical protein